MPFFIRNVPVFVSRNGYIKKEEEHILTRKYQLEWNGQGYFGFVTQRKSEQLRKFCSENHLHFEIHTPFGKRGASYRKEFFNHYQPFFCGCYLCAYCGRLVRGDKLQVDHIYPVARVSQSMRLQKKIKKMGGTSVNSWQNLAPSCSICNSLKSAHMGFWIPLGFIGRHQCIRFFMNCGIFSVFVWLVNTQILPWYHTVGPYLQAMLDRLSTL